MPRTDFITMLFGLAGLALSATLPVGVAHAAKAKATQATPGEDGCYKNIDIKGHPHKLSAVASLSAIRQWSQAATKHGENYAMWHNASGSRLKCEKLPRSDYYSCFASAKPCPADISTAAGKTN